MVMTKTTEYERRIQVAEFDRKIAEMRLEQMERDKARAEFQANWYENAPLSWLLRKTARAFNGAVTMRLTRVTKEVPAYNTTASIVISENITLDDISKLSRSYEQSVQLHIVGPTGAQATTLKCAWIVYRIVRKATKIIFRPVLSRRGVQA